MEDLEDDIMKKRGCATLTVCNVQCEYDSQGLTCSNRNGTVTVAWREMCGVEYSPARRSSEDGRIQIYRKTGHPVSLIVDCENPPHALIALVKQQIKTYS
jgi:hypothetical protein